MVASEEGKKTIQRIMENNMRTQILWWTYLGTLGSCHVLTPV